MQEFTEINSTNPMDMVAHRRGPRPVYGNTSRPVERLAVGPATPKPWKVIEAVSNAPARPIAGWTGKTPPPLGVIKDAHRLRELLFELQQHFGSIYRPIGKRQPLSDKAIEDAHLRKHVLDVGLRDIDSYGKKKNERQANDSPPTAKPTVINSNQHEQLRDQVLFLAFCSGRTPDQNVVRKLLILANQLAWHRKREADHPKRPEQRKVLKELISVAKRLNKAKISENMRPGLHSGIAEAKAALKAIPVGQGPTKFYPQGVIGPTRDRRGRKPRPGNLNDLAAFMADGLIHEVTGDWSNITASEALDLGDALLAFAGSDVRQRRDVAFNKKLKEQKLTPDELKHGSKSFFKKLKESCRQKPANAQWAENMSVAKEYRETAYAEAIRLFLRGSTLSKHQLTWQLRRDEIFKRSTAAMPATAPTPGPALLDHATRP
jgi:hypothetical protein